MEDGSCVYVSPSGERYGKGPDMKRYVSTMLERVVGGDSTAGLDRRLIEEGDIISQDDLDNLVSTSRQAMLVLTLDDLRRSCNPVTAWQL